MRYFLDASFVVALEMSNDNKHKDAAAFWKKVGSKDRFVTTDLVLAEVLAYINGFGLNRKAAEIGDWMLFDSAVELIVGDRELLVNGYDYMARHKDKRYSLADCVSFELMKKLKLTTALTFDRHFVQAGFSVLP